ncbi:unnamed protein product [Lactuca virosa]|uniref:Glutamate receptor n=1 Tax=Lactuca virosa TaxID=75947 RepID=A0AAU9PA56_9ASTR|nr:unnamed protein product [Lactuca virosa]
MLMLLCLQINRKAQEDPAYKEIPVGVILDMGSSYSYSGVGRSVQSCITMAVSEFYMVNPHFQTRIVVHPLDLLEKPKVEAIIGSESTAEAKLLAVLGDNARVPILSLSPCLSCNKHPYFLQVTQDETSQFEGIAAMAESFRWKEVILICEDSDSGRDMTNTLQTKSILVTHRSLISTSSSNELLQEELHKLSTMQTKVFIMHASPCVASHLLVNAKHLGMMDKGYKWIITGKTMKFLNLLEDEVIECMQGAVGFKSYVPQSRNVQNFTSRWRRKYHVMVKLKEINSYALWVYGAVSALAVAVEQVEQLKRKDVETTASDLTQSQRGTTLLLNEMLSISFHGLGGAFQLTNGNGEINAAQVIEIINVMDKGEKRVGFWTRDAGFTKKIGRLNKSLSDEGLEAIIWPKAKGGNPSQTHRMLQLQVSSKILRIGIPGVLGVSKASQVKYDAQSNATVVSGFCADVFRIAFKGLGRDISFQFFPFTGEDGIVNYNDLIYRVYTGEFDAAVGDITITANRSLYVDFTQSFTDLGLGMLSRNTHAGMWIFMEPLSSDLWLVSACFFILLGFVIWILEHQTNKEFQDSSSQQIGTTLWFAFSTLVFAHRQKLHSNLSRFVVIVWLFVVLVLASSYPATLSSLFTIEQIRLASNRDSIGYQGGSFVMGDIVRNLNFKDTRLKPYYTTDEYVDALSHGSKNGGVDAIIDEIPYLKGFLAQYPSGYSMVVSEVTTSGFGFVFPLGSPLVPELSRQISRLRENGSLAKLEKKYCFKSNQQSKDSEHASKILNLKDCRGLFLISGVSMAVALSIFLFYFIHEKLHFTYTMLAGGKLAFIMRILNPKPVVETR